MTLCVNSVHGPLLIQTAMHLTATYCRNSMARQEEGVNLPGLSNGKESGGFV